MGIFSGLVDIVHMVSAALFMFYRYFAITHITIFDSCVCCLPATLFYSVVQGFFMICISTSPAAEYTRPTIHVSSILPDPFREQHTSQTDSDQVIQSESAP